MTDSVIATPYQMLSPEMQRTVESGDRVIFFDYGIAIKRDGLWHVEKETPEAIDFVSKKDKH